LREFQRREEATKRQGWGDLRPDYTTFPVETIYPDLDEVESRKAKILNERFGMGTGLPIRQARQMSLEQFGVDIPNQPPLSTASLTAQDYKDLQEMFG
jgi:hypothetical protein